MVCETRLRPRQTLSERKTEIKKTISALDAALAIGQIKAKVGPQGAVAFDGWVDRNGVSDACAFRQIMATGSGLAKAKIVAAEMAAGRTVDRNVVAAGTHSHDGGHTWHGGH